MTDPVKPPTRRTGITAAAAFVTSALCRPVQAMAQPVTDSPLDGGNGPPITKKYGLGFRVRNLPDDPTTGQFEFVNQPTGSKPKVSSWWVFAVSEGTITKDYYGIPPGPDGPVVSYPVSVPEACVAFRVETNFTLILSWPSGPPPKFYTRPFDRGE